MMSLSLILDGVIIFLLAVTIVAAIKLSLNLKAVRDNRREFESLIASLAEAIGRAEASIQGLKGAANDSGAALQEKIKESQALFDELQLMNEVGNSLAERMQVLAERNREIAQRLEKFNDTDASANVKPAKAKRSATKKKTVGTKKNEAVTPKAVEEKGDDDESSKGSGFAIRDRDYAQDAKEDIESDPKAMTAIWNGEDVPFSSPDELQSTAEKELYEALYGDNKNTKGGKS